MSKFIFDFKFLHKQWIKTADMKREETWAIQILKSDLNFQDV